MEKIQQTAGLTAQNIYYLTLNRECLQTPSLEYSLFLVYLCLYEFVCVHTFLKNIWQESFFPCCNNCFFNFIGFQVAIASVDIPPQFVLEALDSLDLFIWKGEHVRVLEWGFCFYPVQIDHLIQVLPVKLRTTIQKTSWGGSISFNTGPSEKNNCGPP